ncbi:hypothetical protein F0562_030612 [Nyssa sinensis]|uniref:Retrovirus-related Pol polyprotein from transposon TNT 1-94-like beta-barrel domain-containing protein n=1 Tax=Nyssa sinensis TaxID=561372 RepID=A0A5J5AZ06_9ASTE|nr:hypothetical protein F0562_030612 [Nyssa sinensis]
MSSTPTQTDDSTSSLATAAASAPASVPPFSISPNLFHQLPVKLNSTNFLLWKTQFLPMVTGCGFEHYLDHSEPVPLPVLADGSPNPAFKLWKRQDQLVLSWIVASVSEGVLPQLVGTPTASTAWNTLVSAYASGSKAHIRELRAQLHHLHRDTASIETYVVRAKGIANRLAALQHPVSDEELIEFVIAGLGPAYKLFTRMLECRTDDFDFDDLYGMLLTEERRLTREDAVAIIPPSAQFSQFSSPPFTRGRGRWRGGRGRGRTSPPFSSPSHGRARVCPSPKMNNSFRAPTKPSSNLASTSSLTNQTWLLDSGSTHHLTADLDNLVIHSEYTGPEEVTLGNGSQLPITHIGTSHVFSDNRKFSLHDILRVPSATHNLLSVNSFTRSNHVSIEFFPNHFVIKDLATRAILHQGQSDGGLYSFAFVPLRSSIQSYSASLSTWHARLGHANAPTVRRAIDQSLISGSTSFGSLWTAPSTLSALPPPFTLPHSTLVTESMCLDHSSSTPTTSLGMGTAPSPSSSSRLPPHLSACSGSPAAAPSASFHNADVLAAASPDSSLASAAASPRRHPMARFRWLRDKLTVMSPPAQLAGE